jgi:hypothetical protein
MKIRKYIHTTVLMTKTAQYVAYLYIMAIPFTNILR